MIKVAEKPKLEMNKEVEKPMKKARLDQGKEDITKKDIAYDQKSADIENKNLAKDFEQKLSRAISSISKRVDDFEDL